MKVIYRLLLVGALVMLVISITLYLLGREGLTGPFLTGFFILLATGVRGIPATRGFSYTIWIGAAVTVSLFYPEYFISIGSFELKNLIVPLLQIIMFGVGTAMSLKDFAGVIMMPKGVLVGMGCQFTVMPIIGYSLAKLFGFPPEVVAGVILVGSSPSGLASNVMSFIARANLALSVTMTAIATLLAPLITPALMKWLAGEFIPIDFWSMMWSIIKIVIIPVIAGLIFNRIAHGRAKWLDAAMPMVSMVGIGVIITIITAAGRDSLLNIGLLLILACFIHNVAGYGLGYSIARLLRFDERSCRTIALEVGMQNSGLASGIALQMGRVATVGLAAAVFGPLMNMTGSSLATWWRSKNNLDVLDANEGKVPMSGKEMDYS
jgi:BASS family bile acid:Na+ symporter